MKDILADSTNSLNIPVTSESIFNVIKINVGDLNINELKKFSIRINNNKWI